MKFLRGKDQGVGPSLFVSWINYFLVGVGKEGPEVSTIGVTTDVSHVPVGCLRDIRWVGGYSQLP